ncbi:hypothetical protein ACMGDM_17225 [Sphingomonas sp. DT-51]|uniref:hypothetical protein n=1 Tax=Sphingomonas sp. DT-51 TaxID=3396165 RepID=UPI003F1A6C46
MRLLLLLAAATTTIGGSAVTVRRLPAPEARQGVAAGPRDLYAVANYRIARYDKRTGEKRASWEGDKTRFPHLNSCAVIGRDLVCALSNFPAVPQWSSVEFFDPVTLAHRRTVSLGQGIGSLTWVDRHAGAWWAMFANYDGRGGEPGRDHRHTILVRFDEQWRRTQSWTLPSSILERIAPMSISGGGWGPDGRLYLTGHDRPELYAVQLPFDGAVLDHLGTFGIEAAGQAIDWDESASGMLYGIDRSGGTILQMHLRPKRQQPH